MPCPIKRRTPQMQKVEAQFGKPIEILMPELFRELGSMTKVAARMGVPYDTAYYWGRTFGIIAYEPLKARFPLEEASGQVE